MLTIKPERVWQARTAEDGRMVWNFVRKADVPVEPVRAELVDTEAAALLVVKVRRAHLSSITDTGYEWLTAIAKRFEAEIAAALREGK